VGVAVFCPAGLIIQRLIERNLLLCLKLVAPLVTLNVEINNESFFNEWEVNGHLFRS